MLTDLEEYRSHLFELKADAVYALADAFKNSRPGSDAPVSYQVWDQSVNFVFFWLMSHVGEGAGHEFKKRAMSKS